MRRKNSFRFKASARAAAAVVVGMLVWLSGVSFAEAQIKSPGAHPRYSLEVEPHLLWHHAGSGWYGDDDGWGPGVRLSIPIVESGPIKTINNSMAIGFGFDWAHFSGYCGRHAWLQNSDYWNEKCSANEIWLPVVLQWNFYLTEIISVFGEPGLAIVHRRWQGYHRGEFGRETFTDTEFKPLVMFGGGRFQFTDLVGLTVRLGWPYISVGANFLF